MLFADWRQFGVTHCRLNAAMTKVGLQRLHGRSAGIFGMRAQPHDGARGIGAYSTEFVGPHEASLFDSTPPYKTSQRRWPWALEAFSRPAFCRFQLRCGPNCRR